ncbi:hypothetical protein BJX99DRAFT_257993 [Aspergillus californicus]
MYSLLALLFLLTSLPIINAQIGYDAKTSHFRCPSPDAHYCAAGSLKGSSIISCTENERAEIRSCNLELSGILPLGYEGAAVCYESPSRPGHAVCAFNGTGYTPPGTTVTTNVPETILCDNIRIPFIYPAPYVHEHDTAGNYWDTEIILPDQIQSVALLSRDAGEIAGSSPILLPLPLPTQSVPEELVGEDEREGEASSCSNPWSRVSKTGDALTLDIVLVIPTQGAFLTQTQMNMQVQTPSELFVPVKQTLNPISPVNSLVGVSPSIASTLTPTTTPALATMAIMTITMDVTSLGDTSTVDDDLPAKGTSNGSLVIQTGLANGLSGMGSERVVFGGVIPATVFVMVSILAGWV